MSANRDRAQPILRSRGGVYFIARSAVMVFLLTGVAIAAAQSKADREVETFACKDVMREPNSAREVAIAFLHGYLLGKSGNSTLNVEVLENQTNAFIEQCLDSPQKKAVEVMMSIKK
jgi:HdeA/HdeB family